jgi:hypothetical protein
MECRALRHFPGRPVKECRTNTLRLVTGEPGWRCKAFVGGVQEKEEEECRGVPGVAAAARCGTAEDSAGGVQAVAVYRSRDGNARMECRHVAGSTHKIEDGVQ